MSTEFTQLNQISKSLGISTTFVKAVLGLSKPVRAALRMQLTSLKTSLQAEVATHAFKARVCKRKQSDINKLYSAAGAILSQSKRVLNSLNFGPDFSNEPEVQKLISLLLSSARVKGISLGGYRDADNIVNALNFQAQQIKKSVDFGEKVVQAVNAKIDLVDKYIGVLDAVDALE